jgi:hypothetical protein
VIRMIRHAAHQVRDVDSKRGRESVKYAECSCDRARMPIMSAPVKCECDIARMSLSGDNNR